MAARMTRVSQSSAAPEGEDRDRRARLGDPSTFAKGCDRIGRVLHRVEGRYGVERVVRKRDFLEVALFDSAVGHALTDDLKQLARCVQPRDLRAALGGELECMTRPASGVQQRLAVAEPDRIEDRLEERLARRLVELRPVTCCPSPQFALHR